MSNRRKEYSHGSFVGRSVSSANVRSSGRFLAEEVRAILSKTGTIDVRQLGCPDWLFDRVLARRAKKLGVRPGSAAVAEPTDLDARIAAARIF